jgi:hypothetical protein
MKIGRGTEVLGESLHQFHFIHHKLHVAWLELELWPPRWKARDWPLELRHDLETSNIGCAVTEVALSDRPSRVGALPPPRQRTETTSFPKRLCSVVVFRILDDEQSPKT